VTPSQCELRLELSRRVPNHDVEIEVHSVLYAQFFRDNLENKFWSGADRILQSEIGRVGRLAHIVDVT
jgi:hypothetical protein